MSTISIYLIEDSISYRISLKNYIMKYLDSANLIFNFDIQSIQNYIQFYENLENKIINDDDIFIIDIYLNTFFTGIDIGKKIRSINSYCKIIYLTSAADKAIEIINQKISPNAYIMKSEDPEITQMQLIDLFVSLNLDVTNTDKTITVNSYTSNLVLNLSDILYICIFKGARNKLIVKTLNSDLIIDGTISKMKTRLPSPPFYLDFKSIIINNSKIKNISTIKQQITFTNDVELEIKQRLLYKLLRFQRGMK